MYEHKSDFKADADVFRNHINVDFDCFLSDHICRRVPMLDQASLDTLVEPKLARALK